MNAGENPRPWAELSVEQRAELVSGLTAKAEADPRIRGRVEGAYTVLADVVTRGRLMFFGDMEIPVTVHWPSPEVQEMVQATIAEIAGG